MTSTGLCHELRNVLILAMAAASGWEGRTGTRRGKEVVPPLYWEEGQGARKADTSVLV